MNIRFAAIALPVALLCFAAPLSGQQQTALVPSRDETAPLLASPAATYSLPVPGQHAFAALLTAPAPAPFQQRQYHEPTPFILGGTGVGAFAGGLVGYVNCVSGDRDCSVLWRLVAGSAIGSALGAVLWLGSVPQN